MPRKKSKELTERQVAEFEAIVPILQSLLAEARELSKKKADILLNEPKVQMVNKVLERARQLLADEPSAEFLGLLDGEKQPTYSDAVFVMTQHEAAMTQFKDKHYGFDKGSVKKKWITKQRKVKKKAKSK